jgi:hypothetical protein
VRAKATGNYLHSIPKAHLGEQMKLILCPYCGDVFSLRFTMKSCGCGHSWGLYHKDGWHATIGRHAIPVGFINTSFRNAVLNQPQTGEGERFTAFVIPKECESIEVSDSDEEKD